MSGRVVFVGNIPYDISEEQMVDILRQSGPVKSFRLVMDPETGRAKGYGFCEYYDAETANSAVRNLSDYVIGNRKLRVQVSQNQTRDSQSQANNFGQINMLPTLPPGVVPPSGVSVPDAILKTLSSFQPNQLLEVLSQMKAAVLAEPEQARQLLETNPQLSYAILQALLMMKLVDPAILHTVVAANVPAQAPALQPESDPQKAALIAQVMALTDAQINALNPQDRAQILQLRQSIQSGAFTAC